MNSKGFIEIAEFFLATIIGIGIVSQVLLPIWNNIVSVDNSTFSSNWSLVLTFLFLIPTVGVVYLIYSKAKDYYYYRNQY